MNRIDQWAHINALIIAELQAGRPISQLLQDLQWDDQWKHHVPMGRGLGSRPKLGAPFHTFRHLKYRQPNLGETHIRIYNERPTNTCICGYSDGKNIETNEERDSDLDYYAFYHTGEVFTWMDPLFVTGNIPFDPRDPEQPEGPMFAIKWICKDCFDILWAKSEDLIQDYLARWGRLEISALPEIDLTQRRVLRDRRVSRAEYTEWYPFGVRAEDRRSAARRSTDTGPTWANLLDSRDHELQQRRVQARAGVTECNT